MLLEIAEESLLNTPKFNEHIELVIEKCLALEKVPHEVEVSVTVVDDDTIKDMNKSYRNIDKSTDVLSFPQIESKQDGGIAWENVELHPDVGNDTILLGDIVLCEDIAIKQADEYNHSLLREVCFLVAHSMFHLLGYDHASEIQEALMINKQEFVLTKLGITR